MVGEIWLRPASPVSGAVDLDIRLRFRVTFAGALVPQPPLRQGGASCSAAAPLSPASGGGRRRRGRGIGLSESASATVAGGAAMSCMAGAGAASPVAPFGASSISITGKTSFFSVSAGVSPACRAMSISAPRGDRTDCVIW